MSFDLGVQAIKSPACRKRFLLFGAPSRRWGHRAPESTATTLGCHNLIFHLLMLAGDFVLMSRRRSGTQFRKTGGIVFPMVSEPPMSLLGATASVPAQGKRQFTRGVLARLVEPSSGDFFAGIPARIRSTGRPMWCLPHVNAAVGCALGGHESVHLPHSLLLEVIAVPLPQVAGTFRVA